MAIENPGLYGGVYLSDKIATTDQGSVLVLLYSDGLAGALKSVKSMEEKIAKDLFHVQLTDASL